MIQLDRAVVGAAHELEVVRRHDHGGARRVDLAQQLEDAARRALVEIAGRLVGDEHERIVDQRARESRRAAVRRPTARAGYDVAFDARPTCVSTRRDLVPDRRPRRADHLERERDVCLRGPILEQPEVLEDDAEPAAQLRDVTRVGW